MNIKEQVEMKIMVKRGFESCSWIVFHFHVRSPCFIQIHYNKFSFYTKHGKTLSSDITLTAVCYVLTRKSCNNYWDNLNAAELRDCLRYIQRKMNNSYLLNS